MGLPAGGLAPGGGRPAAPAQSTRPVRQHPSGAALSLPGGGPPLKPEVVAGLDLVVVRELTGGLYFGEKRREWMNGEERARDTLVYSTGEIRRIGRLAFELARKRRKHLTSVDKANVIESSRLWRQEIIKLGEEYPDVALDHLYVDNCAMQLVRRPTQFDVIVTENMFGDILTDEASALTGSIGMLPSASIGGKVAL